MTLEEINKALDQVMEEGPDEEINKVLVRSPYFVVFVQKSIELIKESPNEGIIASRIIACFVAGMMTGMRLKEKEEKQIVN